MKGFDARRMSVIREANACQAVGRMELENMDKLDLKGPLVLVGAGKMGGALLTGLVNRGVDVSNIVVQDPAPPADMRRLLEKHGIRCVAELGDLGGAPDVVLMAVKPQVMDAVFEGLASHIGKDTVVLSIAAGRTIASFEKHLVGPCAVVRAMPNTPAAIGRGISVCCANAHTSQRQRDLCEALLSCVGDTGWVEDEALMDAVTAVSGSGPAYVFLLAECMAAAGVTAGLPEGLAQQLARSTVSGSGALLAASDLDAKTLRENVTSPGGTTAAALAVLMGQGDGLAGLMERAVDAANKRGRELSK